MVILNQILYDLDANFDPDHSDAFSAQVHGCPIAGDGDGADRRWPSASSAQGAGGLGGLDVGSMGDPGSGSLCRPDAGFIKSFAFCTALLPVYPEHDEIMGFPCPRFVPTSIRGIEYGEGGKP